MVRTEEEERWLGQKRKKKNTEMVRTEEKEGKTEMVRTEEKEEED